MRLFYCFFLLSFLHAHLTAQNTKPSINYTDITLRFADSVRRNETRAEIGVLVGGLRYFGDLTQDKSFDVENQSLFGSVFYRKRLRPMLALRGNLLVGQTAGKDEKWGQRGFSFTGRVTELSGQIEWEIFGKRRFRRVDTTHYKLERFRQIAEVDKVGRFLSPYVFVGGGFASFKANTDYTQSVIPGEDFQRRVAEDKAKSASAVNGAGLIFGGGVNLDIGHNWAIGLELGARAGFSDYTDGVSVSGFQENPDWYWTGGLTLSRRLGERDKDGDGIVDSKDKCPDWPGSSRTKGCPDVDQDLIADRDDECPTKKGFAIMSGCPMRDMDNDSVPDIEDICPNVPGLAAFKGCPDTDRDGVEDKLDSCVTVKGVARFNGCPDTDEDGIEDKIDKCPTEKGVADYAGCPVTDTDKDGVEDKLDACPAVAGKALFKGCPDTDDDGVEDAQDACPQTKGLATNKGCPFIEQKDQEKLDLAIKGVKFETGKAVLKSESNKLLNEVVGILVRYPDYQLRIEGHTDDQGKDEDNQLLSEKRAQACADYLNKKGISLTRFVVAGFGETRPIADNKTSDGRKLNRRVEFILQPL
jgi:OmpA-OmpF porin, OOP family